MHTIILPSNRVLVKLKLVPSEQNQERSSAGAALQAAPSTHDNGAGYSTVGMIKYKSSNVN